jgi:hypothetical protein
VVSQLRVAPSHGNGLTRRALTEGQLEQDVRAGVEPEVVEVDDRQRCRHDG